VKADTGSRERRILLALTALCAIMALAVAAAAGDWLFSDVCCVCSLALLTSLLLIALFVGASLHLAVRLYRKRAGLADFLPLLIIVASIILASELPSKPAVIFPLHREEFVRLAEWAVARHGESLSFSLPSRPFYKDAILYRDFSGAIVVEFITGNFYLPLVYISTDNPDDVYDTCSAGGGPVERLEPHWYVCQRDWN
jgi:hypothetical protein